MATEVARLAGEYGVEELVMGFPRNMDGTEGPRAERYRGFAERLREATGLEPVLWDERRTTIEAHDILHTAGKKMKNHKKTVDAVAAALITYKLLPWLKVKLSNEQQAALTAAVKVLAYAAEQVYGAGRGDEKLKYVEEGLRERGFEVDRAAIEAAVKGMGILSTQDGN